MTPCNPAAGFAAASPATVRPTAVRFAATRPAAAYRRLPAMLTLAALLLASGCALFRQPPAFTPPPDHLWRLQGKLSYQSGADLRQFILDWRRSGQGSTINLSRAGVIGVFLATITITPAKDIQLDSQFTLADELKDSLADLPFDLLLAWLDQAFAGAGAPSAKAAGPWRLAVLSYEGSRPSLVELTHPEAKLRLSIHSWT